MNVQTEQELVALCLALIGGHGGLSAAEHKLVKTAPASALKLRDIEAIRKAISRGTDRSAKPFRRFALRLSVVRPVPSTRLRRSSAR